MKTVYVIGAGASCDFGFPTGEKLKEEISRLILKYEGKSDLWRAINLAESLFREKGKSIDEVHDTATWLANTLSIYPSIDEFLDKHSELNDYISLLGKICISTIIAGREANCDLKTNDSAKIDWEARSKTYIGQLWKSSVQGGMAKNQEDPLPRISFVTFNYDRCIEKFITLAISQSYQVSIEDALQIAKNIHCEHVYGSLGDIFTHGEMNAFGSAREPHQFVKISERIKTFTEQVDSLAHDRIRKIFQDAQRVIFLGFSFGRLNRDFLRPMITKSDHVEFFGTCYEMEVPDQLKALQWLRTDCNGVADVNSLVNAKADEFFIKNRMLF